MRARLTLDYADRCQCDRPPLRGATVAIRPRLRFPDAARLWARVLGLTDLRFNSRDEIARGFLNVECPHRLQQIVQIGLELDRPALVEAH